MKQLYLFPEDSGSSPGSSGGAPQNPGFTEDQALAACLPLIKKWEGFRAKPYKDIVGVPTIGYGSTFYEDGTKVTMNDSPISEEKAEALLLKLVRRNFLPAVKSVFPYLQTANQAGALLSLTYNIGSTKFLNSTLVRKLKANDIKGAAEQILVWNVAGGVPVAGLTNRRKDEYQVFNG